MKSIVLALITLAILLGIIIALSRVDHPPTTISPPLHPVTVTPYYGDRGP